LVPCHETRPLGTRILPAWCIWAICAFGIHEPPT
jgi:hypothetical protein